MNEYEDYETKCEEIINQNAEYLTLFEQELINKELTDKTIKRHLSNVEFYLNTFLATRNLIEMEAGVMYIDDYLGDFFIRKCMWSNPSNIKSTASSIKKFYKCMLDNEKIKKGSYQYLCVTTKDNMDFWQETCAIYNDPEQENPFYIF